MDFERLERRLERAFTARPVRVGDGSIVWRRKPAPLWRFVDESSDAEEREDYSDLEAWPGNVAELLGTRASSVLGFYWDGFGPTSSVAGVVLLELERASYLCQWDETNSYLAVAKLQGWKKPKVLGAAVSELLRENGHPHGVSVFGSLPTETTNYSPSLVPSRLIKQAYFDWLQADPWKTKSTWSELAEEHYSRAIEPNSLTRSLDFLHTLPRLDEPGEVSAWVAEREDESARIPDHARQQLFDEWFATSYEESSL
jgi:hypothetical protein